MCSEGGFGRFSAEVLAGSGSRLLSGRSRLKPLGRVGAAGIAGGRMGGSEQVRGSGARVHPGRRQAKAEAEFAKAAQKGLGLGKIARGVAGGRAGNWELAARVEAKERVADSFATAVLKANMAASATNKETDSGSIVVAKQEEVLIGTSSKFTFLSEPSEA